MIDLILIRGLPSSGKTTLANLLLRNEEDCDERLDGHFETDQFFMKNGVYRFDEERIAEAHRWCYEQVRDQIWDRSSRTDHSVIVVSNTFSQRWEMQPYIELVELASNSVKWTVVDLFDGGCSDEMLFRRNKHGVPLEVFRIMRDGYEHDWRNANPKPPCDRVEPVHMAYVKVQGVKYGPYPLKEARKEADRLGGFITEN